MEEKDKKSNGNELGRQVDIFMNYGVFGGVLLPFLIPILGILWDFKDLSMDVNYPIAKGMEIYVIIIMLLYIIIVLVIINKIFAGIINDYRESKRKATTIILYVIGLFSIFVLFLIILWTGGLSKSPFTGYFIYVPVVVYITFQNIGKAFVAAICAILLAICSTPAIMPSLFSSYNSINSSSSLYQCYYLIVLCWQIIASILVAAAFNFNIMDAVKSPIKKLFIRNNLEQK